MNQIATKPMQGAAIAAPPQDGQALRLVDDIESRTEQFAHALPAHIPVERFKRVVMTAVSMNGALAKADRRSFFNAAMRAAQDGLLPDGREGALVIYKTKVKEGGQERWIEAVQWMPMIGGIRKKVRNSGEILSWNAHVVYAKDTFDYQLGLKPDLHHKPLLSGDRGKPVAAYSVATLKGGEVTFEVMSADEIWAVWSRSSKNKDKDGKPSGPWKDWEGEMFRKTVARRHSKVLPMSTDLDDLIRRDDDLYDFEGKSDRAPAERETPPRRPQLTDFTDVQQSDEQEPEQGQPGNGAVAEEAKPDEPADVGPPEAMEFGRKAFAEKKSLHSIPPEIVQLGLAEAWQEGWRKEEAETTAEKAKALRNAKDGA